MLTRSILGVVLVALSAAGWFWLSAEDAKDLSSPVRARAEGRPIPVRTAGVQKAEIDEIIGATAVTVPSEVVSITESFSRDPASRALVIKEVRVWEGKRVAKDEVLFLIEDDLFAQDLAAAEVELKSSKSTLALAERALEMNQKLRELKVQSAKSELDYRTEDLKRLEKDYQRLESVYKDKFIPTIDLAEAFTKLAEARFRRTEAEGQLRLLRTTLTLGPLEDTEALIKARGQVESSTRAVELAERNLRRTRIVSPIDGFAEDVSVVPGQVIAMNVELARILKIDPLHVRALLPLDRSHMIEVGQDAEVVLDNRPQEVLSGQVLRISPEADEDTKSLPIVIQLANPGFRVKPGVSAVARIRLERSTTLVPSVAVLSHGGQSMVFVVDEGIARIRKITTGAVAQVDSLEVLSGVEPGEQVVVYGNRHLQDKDPVNSDWRAWSGRD